jgi:biopolymer transport protein ExbB
MSTKYLAVIVAVTTIIAIFGVCYLAYGQDSVTDAQPTGQTKKKTFWDLLKAGATVGWGIILTSVIGVALAIEHFVNIRRDKLAPPDTVGELEALIDEGQYDEALSLCESERTFLTNCMGAALAKVNDGPEAMKNALETVGEEEAFKLNQKISYLSLIGNVAPMLGLLGTVTGMIGAFTIIEQVAAPSPALLARGVYEALVTTCQGLVVSIPILSVYFYFKNKVTRLIIEMGIISGELLGRVKPGQ